MLCLKVKYTRLLLKTNSSKKVNWWALVHQVEKVGQNEISNRGCQM